MLKMGKGWEMAFEVKNEVMGQVTLVWLTTIISQ
jgi:hypothetical protein